MHAGVLQREVTDGLRTKGSAFSNVTVSGHPAKVPSALLGHKLYRNELLSGKESVLQANEQAMWGLLPLEGVDLCKHMVYVSRRARQHCQARVKRIERSKPAGRSGVLANGAASLAASTV